MMSLKLTANLAIISFIVSQINPLQIIHFKILADFPQKEEEEDVLWSISLEMSD